MEQTPLHKTVMLLMQLTYWLEKHNPEVFREVVKEITKQTNQTNNGKEQGIYTSTAQETE